MSNSFLEELAQFNIRILINFNNRIFLPIIFAFLVYLPTSPDLLHAQTALEFYDQGKNLQASKNFDEAIKAFENAINKDNKFADAFFEIATCYFEEDLISNRMKAERAIDDALKIDPNNTTYLFFLSDLKLKQSFKNESKRILERIVEIDPTFQEAQYQLIELYADVQDGLNTKEKRIFEKIISNLVQISEESSEIPDINYIIAQTYSKIDDFSKAEQHYFAQLENNPRHALSNIHLGLLYFHNGDNERATQFYLQGIEYLADLTILDQIYAEMKPIFTDRENKNYNNASNESKGTFLANYWRRNDPNILNSENERLIEHLRRTEFVRRMYFENNSRGYDDRGEIYLKYGEPDQKYVHTGIGEDLGQNIKDNESWLYSNIDINLAYDFVAVGSRYRLVPDLSHVSVPASYDIARKFYTARGYLGGIYNIIAGKAFGGGSPENFERFMIMDILPRKDQAISEAPPQKFNLEFEEIPIQFAVDYAQFKGDNNRTDIEIYFGVPLNQLTVTKSSGFLSGNMNIKVVVLDSTSSRRGELNNTKIINTSISEDGSEGHFLTKEMFPVQHGSYMFGIQVDQKEANRLGIYQLPIQIRDFNANELMISDLRLSPGDRQANFVETDSRDKLEMRSHPFSTISKSDNVLLYFEIYNLEFGTNDRTHYSVQYTIQNESSSSGIFNKIGGLFSRKNKELISSREERRGENRSVNQLISLDISDLPESNMVISVQIEDNVSGQITTISKDIKIVK